MRLARQRGFGLDARQAHCRYRFAGCDDGRQCAPQQCSQLLKAWGLPSTIPCRAGLAPSNVLPGPTGIASDSDTIEQVVRCTRPLPLLRALRSAPAPPPRSASPLLSKRLGERSPIHCSNERHAFSAHCCCRRPLLPLPPPPTAAAFCRPCPGKDSAAAEGVCGHTAARRSQEASTGLQPAQRPQLGRQQAHQPAPSVELPPGPRAVDCSVR